MIRLCIALSLLAGTLTRSVLAQSDQQVYTDSLVNGWQNWSWATVNLANSSPVHSGTASASVTATAPWQAIYLHHDAFDSSGFTALVFWIHGGTTGGQLLQVQVTLNGTAQTAVALAPLPANTWQKITLSLTSLGVADQPNLDGFWIQDRSGLTQPTYFVDDISLTAAPPPSVVNLAVNASQTLRTIDRRHFGLNAAVWDSVFDTPTTVSLLTEMGNQTLRFPGGSLSDDYHWQSNTTDANTWRWATSFDSFAQVATTTAAQVIITVNYGSGTSAEAAGWVSYANVTKASGYKYWEIGNECYGSWETDNNTRPHDPYTYANRFMAYWTQMKAIDPTIKIGAVAVNGEDSYANYTDHPATNLRTGQTHNGWTPVMLATLKSLGITPDFLIYHRYPEAPGAESDAGLLQSSGTWATDAADLRQQLNDYLGTAAPSVELVCTENNSVYSNPGKQSTSLVNGLFLADSIGNALKTEFNGVIWWDLRNGQETGNNNSSSLYGWRLYGDYGIVDGANLAGPADRYPTFYVAKLLQHFARGGDSLVGSSSDYSLLTCYAAQRTDGSLTLLVINKSATTTLNGNINISGYSPTGTIYAYSYGIPQDQAAQTGTGSADLAINSYSGAASTMAFSFPPYSATVLSLNAFQCVTRDVAFWSSHVVTPPFSTASCVTLSNVFNLMPGGLMNLGFVQVNLGGALGLFWGNPIGTGGQGSADDVCIARKALAKELIAAIANVELLNPDSSSCGVQDPQTGGFILIGTLIAEAQAATQAELNILDCSTPGSQAAWVAEMNALTALLNMFNGSGVSLPFPGSLIDCGIGAANANYITAHQADPTTQSNCTCVPQ